MTPGSAGRFNPCLEEPDLQVPVKIWELLRRNKRFRQAVGGLMNLDERAKANDPSPREPHWNAAMRVVERTEARHVFAGIALQWLVPEPVFIIRRYAAPEPGAPPRLVSLMEGTQANPKASIDWRTYEPQGDLDPESVANACGRCHGRGPLVEWTTSEDPRFADKVDPIQEWQQYVSRDPFVVNSPWPEAPPGFRRDFAFLWRSSFDCRPNNAITMNRSDSPQPHEIDTGFLFAGIEHALRARLLKRQAVPVVFLRDMRKYRSVALPRTILTKGSADAMGKWLTAQLKRDRPEVRAPASATLRELPRDAVGALADLSMNIGSGLALEDAITFQELADTYRVFLVPRRRRASLLIGRQLAAHLKEGSDDWGALTADGLLNARELLGTTADWQSFLDVERQSILGAVSETKALVEAIRQRYGARAVREFQRVEGGAISRPAYNKATETALINSWTDFKNRVDYVKRLRDEIFPRFDVHELLAPVDFRRSGSHPVSLKLEKRHTSRSPR